MLYLVFDRVQRSYATDARVISLHAALGSSDTKREVSL